MAGPGAALVAAMLAFASASSGLPLPPGAAPPVITLSTRQFVGSYGDGQDWAALTRWWQKPVEIVLHAGWSETDPEDRCMLAHELVHYLQEANGLRYDPITRAEPLAYRTTALCFEAEHLAADKIRWAWREVRRYGGIAVAGRAARRG